MSLETAHSVLLVFVISKKNIISTAKSAIFILRTVGRSLIKVMYSNGDKHDPWGA